VAAASFIAAALIGTAPALEAQAIARPAARLRKKSLLRMDTSSGVPSATTALTFASRRCSEARVCAQCPETEKIDVYLFQAKLEPSCDNSYPAGVARKTHLADVIECSELHRRFGCLSMNGANRSVARADGEGGEDVAILPDAWRAPDGERRRSATQPCDGEAGVWRWKSGPNNR
jgi:hypothetical protein